MPFERLEKRRCHFCTDEFFQKDVPKESERNITDRWEKHMVKGADLCPECIKHRDKGNIILIGIDLDKSDVTEDDLKARIKDVALEGVTAYLAKATWEMVFPMPYPPNGVAFMESDTIHKLNYLFENVPNLQPGVRRYRRREGLE